MRFVFAWLCGTSLFASVLYSFVCSVVKRCSNHRVEGQGIMELKIYDNLVWQQIKNQPNGKK